MEETKKPTGFERCLADWQRLHIACPLGTGRPDEKGIELMRHGYLAGKKDGRQRKS